MIGQEGIGIGAEIVLGAEDLKPPEALIKAIRQAVAEAYQEAPCVVLLLNPGALPKTSSGKLQRASARCVMPMAASIAMRSSRPADVPAPNARRGRSCKAGSRRSGANSCTWRAWRPTITSSRSAAPITATPGGRAPARRPRPGAEPAHAVRSPDPGRLCRAYRARNRTVALPKARSTPYRATKTCPNPWPRIACGSPQLIPWSSAYTIPGALLRLRGELDEDAVRASFST